MPEDFRFIFKEHLEMKYYINVNFLVCEVSKLII